MFLILIYWWFCQCLEPAPPEYSADCDRSKKSWPSRIILFAFYANKIYLSFSNSSISCCCFWINSRLASSSYADEVELGEAGYCCWDAWGMLVVMGVLPLGATTPYFPLSLRLFENWVVDVLLFIWSFSWTVVGLGMSGKNLGVPSASCPTDCWYIIFSCSTVWSLV